MSDKLTEVRGELQEALQLMAETIGPRNCVHGDFAECEEECTFDDTTPVDDMVVLEEFVLVMQWRTMNDNQWHAGMHTVPGQPITRTNGLLVTALMEM